MIRFELKLLLRPAAQWLATLLGILAVFVLLYPFMTGSGLLGLLSSRLDMVPDFVMRMFGLEGIPDFAQFPAYFNLCVFYMQMKLCTFACVLGCESLISEETDGTIEFLYAQPVRRIAIVLGKFASRALMLALLNAAYAAVSAAVMAAMGGDVPELILSLASAVLPQLGYLMLGMLISALLPSSRLASSCALSLFFATYALGIVPSLMGTAYFLEYLSPCNMVMTNAFMQSGFMPNWQRVGVTGAMAIAALAACAAVYCRRDMRLQ